jgi:RimJ/RimL family protein N-acetyltransferase
MKLTTERLTISVATVVDIPFLLQLLNSEGWKKYIGDRNVYTLEEAEVYFSTRWVGKMANNPHCGMYIIKLHDGTRVGTNSLVQRDFLDSVDIGYAFLDEHGGKGYGTEATKAFLDYVTNDLGYEKVMGFCLTSHPASMRIMEKLGMTKGEAFMDKGEECVLYSISKTLG